MWVFSRPLGRSELARLMRLPSLGISARSAAVSAVVVLVALGLAGATFDLILYRSLLAGVDDATAGRVRTIVDAHKKRRVPASASVESITGSETRQVD